MLARHRATTCKEGKQSLKIFFFERPFFCPGISSLSSIVPFQRTKTPQRRPRTGKGKLVVEPPAGNSIPAVVLDPIPLVVLVGWGERKDVQGLFEGRVQREEYGVHGGRVAGHRSQSAGLARHHQELAQKAHGAVGVETHAILLKKQKKFVKSVGRVVSHHRAQAR